jgi:hypothetical protein
MGNINIAAMSESGFSSYQLVSTRFFPKRLFNWYGLIVIGSGGAINWWNLSVFRVT